MSRPKFGYVPPDGRLRLSQVVSTSGPGAMLDLVESAAIVSGLDHWRYQSTPTSYEIDLPRLRDRVMRTLRDRKIELQHEAPFRTAPPADEREPAYANGIPVFEFPTWFVCQNPECRALARASELESKSERRWHQCPDGKRRFAVPVRFVRACASGHLDDFNWKIFAHYGKPTESCQSSSLTLHEGATGDFSEIEVRCGCGAKQRLMTAYDLPQKCTGQRPWLGRDAAEVGCEQQMRPLIRTASHSYFPQVMSALAIPEHGSELRDKLNTVWDAAIKIENSKDIAEAKKWRDKFRLAVDGYSDEQILEEIEKLRAGKALEREPLRTAEFKQLCDAPVERPGDLPPPPGQDYFARRLA